MARWIRCQRRITDAGLIQLDARFLDFAPVLSDENTGASLEMTRMLGMTKVESGFER